MNVRNAAGLISSFASQIYKLLQKYKSCLSQVGARFLWLLILLVNKHGVIIIATILHHDNFVILWHIVFVWVGMCCR